MKTLVKLVVWLFVLVLAAVVVIPLVVLAGLFIWLKLTEEADEEALELRAGPGDGRDRLTDSPAPLDAERAPVSFLIDYDGTISLVDIGDTLLARHYGDAAEIAAKDALYDAGELGSRELMKWDMDVLPHDAELLRREAAAMPQDGALPAFVAAVEARGAQVEIVSDGLGFYVRPNLAAAGPGAAAGGDQRQPSRGRW